MAELPKFVRERLKASPPPAARSTPGESAGSDPAVGPHPDTNLISAFLENALNQRERAEVLQHLSYCAECRAVASFALPEPEAAPVVAPVREERNWARWTMFRWVSLAASAVVIAIAVLVLRPQDHRQTRADVYSTTAGKPAVSVSPVQAPDATPAPEQQPEPKKDAVKAIPGSLVARQTVPKLKVKNEQPLAMADRGFRASAGLMVTRQEQAVERPTTPAPSAAAIANAQQQRAGGPLVNQFQQNAAAQQNQNAALNVLAAPPKPSDNATPSPADKSTQVRVVPEISQTQGVIGGVAPTAKLARAAPAIKKPARQRAEAATVESAAQWVAVQPATDRLAALKTPAVRWTVSDQGKIVRSSDAGQTWTYVPVADDIRFRALSAIGADIWAGGTSGALFHSTDGGTRWTRVRPVAQDANLTADITRIEFTDAQHGTVITAGGDRWVTSDGGMSWSLVQNR